MPELSLECIGDDTAQLFRQWESIENRFLGARHRGPSTQPWCAEVTGERSSGSFELRFLRGRKDYTHANSVGSRGIYLWYTLLEGQCYWVQSPETWKRTRRYYVTVHEGATIEISEEDVRSCLNDRSV